jgi:oligosaccharyltransferase complex subunit alpha (ribophorin I)
MLIDDAYYPSLYHTKKMKSTFEVGESATIIKATEIESGEVRGRSIRYGTYKNIEPLKSHPVYIYVDYDDAIPVFTEVKRTITLSHWRGINIEEEYKLLNKISALEGEFGRLDFSPWKIKHSINNLDCKLPVYTRDLYYTDEIGNITTSNAYRANTEVEFVIEPRFPLMGGWKTYWKQGYTLPKEKYIKKLSEEGSYKFEINLSHPYKDIVAEDFTLKINLPEGATDIGIEMPFDMDASEQEISYQYLDLRGRICIVLKKTNVLEKYHNKPIIITYKLTAFDMYLKVFIMMFYTFCVLFFSMVFYRWANYGQSKVKTS